MPHDADVRFGGQRRHHSRVGFLFASTVSRYKSLFLPGDDMSAHSYSTVMCLRSSFLP